MASERAEQAAMASNRKISSNTSSPSSLSPAPPTATERPQEKRKPGGSRAGLWMKRMDMAEEDIDASAEQFIKRFREDLLLQRLQSIENYKQMLARGV
ncbi:pathogen-associated molecular patterns-induced protein A70 [Dendrobium catenatum]|uniref:Uncharacterized protein n=1 Tax=Dendrobium catenatum TaxID=906689 RepID=A0A2I0VEP4_9ASPA|nr:pathogen-associated molecular patterns-induced protein A70 [Dendrobium catenatum]PKU61892.1 hypothetical protein MA16_Dca017225 [Dendrobium catenatum]